MATRDTSWRRRAGCTPSPEAYLLAFSAAIGGEVGEADWVSIRGGAMTPMAESLAAVQRAAELGQVTLLTNNGPLAGKHLGTLAPELVPLFGEHLFTSSDYAARKPDPTVFERVLKRYGTRQRMRSSPTTCPRTWRARNRWESPRTCLRREPNCWRRLRRLQRRGRIRKSRQRSAVVARSRPRKSR